MHLALGHYYFPLQNKVPSCPLLTATPPRRSLLISTTSWILPQRPTYFHNTSKKQDRSHSSESKSSIQWLEAKAKASAGRVAAQKIPGRRVRNHTAQRLACRCVIPPWCIVFSVVTRPPICYPRLHYYRIHSERASTRFAKDQATLIQGYCRLYFKSTSSLPRIRLEDFLHMRQCHDVDIIRSLSHS